MVSVLVFAISCASKPPAPVPEPTPAPPPVVEVKPEPKVEAPAAPAISQEELDKLLADAQALKKKSFDLKLFEVLPDDYKAANAKYDAGLKAYNDKDAKAAKDGLELAISTYNDLIARGVVLVAAAKKKSAEEMRSSAVKAGADSTQTGRFGAGEDAFKTAASLVDGAKAEDAIPVYVRAQLYYELAYKRASASERRQNIADKSFAKWDPGNFQLAETKFQAEDGFWASANEADRASGVGALDESILRYNLVIQKGREMTVATAKEKTDASKQRADSIKANVAVKELYDSAQNAYKEGASQLTAKDYETSADSFTKAGVGFEQAYESAAEKRANADKAMKAAEEAHAESQRKAEEADPLIQQASTEGGQP